jgi:hypothetical protein
MRFCFRWWLLFYSAGLLTGLVGYLATCRSMGYPVAGRELSGCVLTYLITCATRALAGVIRRGPSGDGNR